VNFLFGVLVGIVLSALAIGTPLRTVIAAVGKWLAALVGS
jgi:hypothetical protein